MTQRGRPGSFTAFMALLIVAASAAPTAADTWFVDASAPTPGDGRSWETPFADLSEALLYHATAGDEVWVAAGTYHPSLGALADDRCTSFVLPPGVRLYGGFGGDETQRAARDPAAHPTILSGDLGVPGLENDNAYHVIRVESTPEEPVNGDTLLDGFIVRDGYAWPTTTCATDASFARGGGLYALAAAPTVRNCTFHGNKAQETGGAVYAEAASPVFISCTFIANEALLGAYPDPAQGGAIAVHLTDSEHIDVEIVNCRFDQNRALGASGSGGAVYLGPLVAAGTFELTLANCLLVGNQAATGAAVGGSTGTSAAVTNCTIVGHNTGAAVAVLSTSVLVRNTIFWFNGAGSMNGPFGTLEHCIIDEPWNGAGRDVFSADPRFADPAAGDFRLQADSPAFDRGANAALDGLAELFDSGADGGFSGPLPDLDGARRIEYCIVDLGAYEQDRCPTDLDGDDITGFADMLALLSSWGPCPDCAADLDGSTDVSFGDLLLLLAEWGVCPCAP